MDITANICAVILKYASRLQERPDQPCPGPRFQQRAILAFRFVRKPATENDFEPRPEVATPTAQCSAYAISMFGSLAQAQAKYRSLAAANDDGGATAIQRYGDHIAEIALVEADGLSDAPNKKGHFGLHPASGIAFAARISAYTPCEYLADFRQRKTPDNAVQS
jgi:hypothetical protein